MEAVIEHMLEPEIAGPAPRRLRLPLRTRLLLGVAGLLLGVFALGSARALWEAGTLTWLAAAGWPVSGQIIEIRTAPPLGPKDPAPRQIAVRYAALVPGPRGPVSETGWVALGEPPAGPQPGRPSAPAAPPPLRLGQHVPLRVARLGGAVLCQPWGPGAGSRIGALVLTGGLVLAVSAFLFRRLTRWTGSRVFLLRRGTAAVGTITHARSEAEDSPRYFVRYGYPGGPDTGREEQVSAEQWRTFHVGQPVSVLYDPDDPSRAGLYALIAQK